MTEAWGVYAPPFKIDGEIIGGRWEVSRWTSETAAMYECCRRNHPARGGAGGYTIDRIEE